MSKISLEVECCAWLNEDGKVETSIYFGRDAEPAILENFDLKELVDTSFNSYCVVDKIHEMHFEEVEELLNSLKSLYKYAESRAEELGYED
jgi:hypothetical protein